MEWTSRHAERAIKNAEKKFEEYERLYDADNQKKTDDLYMEFISAKDLALEVACTLGTPYLIKKAKHIG